MRRVTKTPSAASSTASPKVGWAKGSLSELFGSGTQPDGEVINRIAHAANSSFNAPAGKQKKFDDAGADGK